MTIEAANSSLSPIIYETQTEEESEKVASGLQGVIGMNLGAPMAIYARSNKLGHVLNSSTTYNFNDGLPRREPDVSFVSLEKMPLPLDEELTFAPELVVEVVSKTDYIYETEKKVQQYQRAGVRLVWVVYPVSQIVSVYHLATGLTPQAVNISGELDGEDVLPGFKIAVKVLFE